MIFDEYSNKVNLSINLKSDFYYPLNWLHGSVKFDLKKVTAENFNQETQTVWLKSQTSKTFTFFP